MKVDLPEGERNGVCIKHFEISDSDATTYNMRLMYSGHGHRRVQPGRYTKLVMNGGVMMSDTPAEQNDHAWFVKHATGRVLVTGLGLGMVVQAVAAKPEVSSVTVLENSPDVIALVAPHLPPNVTVIEADAHTYKFPPGTKFDAVWNDIWQDISVDDAASRATLNRKFFRLCTTDVKGAWATPEFRRAYEQERKERSRYRAWGW